MQPQEWRREFLNARYRIDDEALRNFRSTILPGGLNLIPARAVYGRSAVQVIMDEASQFLETINCDAMARVYADAGGMDPNEVLKEEIDAIERDLNNN